MTDTIGKVAHETSRVSALDATNWPTETDYHAL